MVVVPAQIVVGVPVIEAGVVFTVSAFVTRQLEPVVYVTVAVPAAPPVTTPVEEFTDMEPVPLVRVHVPPATVLVSVMAPDVPVQTVEGPPIAAGVW